MVVSSNEILLRKHLPFSFTNCGGSYWPSGYLLSSWARRTFSKHWSASIFFRSRVSLFFLEVYLEHVHPELMAAITASFWCVDINIWPAGPSFCVCVYTSWCFIGIKNMSFVIVCHNSRFDAAGDGIGQRRRRSRQGRGPRWGGFIRHSRWRGRRWRNESGCCCSKDDYWPKWFGRPSIPVTFFRLPLSWMGFQWRRFLRTRLPATQHQVLFILNDPEIFMCSLSRERDNIGWHRQEEGKVGNKKRE